MNKREEKSNSSHAKYQKIQIYKIKFGNYISAVTTMISIPHLRTSRIAATPENTRTREQWIRLYFFFRLRCFLFIYSHSFAPHVRVLTHSLTHSSFAAIFYQYSCIVGRTTNVMCAKSSAIYFTTTTRTQYERARLRVIPSNIQLYIFDSVCLPSLWFAFGFFFLIGNECRLWGRQQGIGSRHWFTDTEPTRYTHILGHGAAIASDNWTRKCIGRCSLRCGNLSPYRWLLMWAICVRLRVVQKGRKSQTCVGHASRFCRCRHRRRYSCQMESKKRKKKKQQKTVERDANGWVAHRCRCQRYRRRHRPKCEKKLDFVQKQIHCWQ